MEGIISKNLAMANITSIRLNRSDLGTAKYERINVDGDLISYNSDESERIGVYMAGYPLTPEACYYEAEIIDMGIENSISIGLCSRRQPMDVYVGSSRESVAIRIEDGRLIKEGIHDTQLSVTCECGDRIGCGIKFQQLTGKQSDPFCTMVPVYFVRNGREIGTTMITLPLGGLLPAVSMHSIGEEVRLFLDLNWVPEEDTLMSVDNNEDEWYRLNDIRLNGQILEYTGRGKSIVDVGLAQARLPVNTTHHYFEIEIIDPGENCYIAIGLTRRDYPKHRHPGWNKGSIGYHADDGKIFIGSGVGDPFGPRCYKGDIMGCGIIYPRDYISDSESDGSIDFSPSSPEESDEMLVVSADGSDSEDEDWWQNHYGMKMENEVKVFFTRNGRIVGIRQVRVPKGGFFPTIGMLSVEEKVRVDLRPLSGFLPSLKCLTFLRQSMAVVNCQIIRKLLLTSTDIVYQLKSSEVRNWISNISLETKVM